MISQTLRKHLVGTALFACFASAAVAAPQCQDVSREQALIASTRIAAQAMVPAAKPLASQGRGELKAIPAQSNGDRLVKQTRWVF